MPDGLETPSGASLGQYVCDEMLRHHIISRCYGSSGLTLLWGPALVITKQEIDHLVTELDLILAEVESQAQSALV